MAPAAPLGHAPRGVPPVFGKAVDKVAGGRDHPAVDAPSYVGLASAGEAEIVIKKSRFLGFAWPVADADEAEGLIQRLREAHREARHVCFAYRLGLEQDVMKSSDDGEPSGTAGRPILEVLLQRGVHGALVAVVRYFGGVLLGAPGLVRAYSQAASRAVDAAGTVVMVPHLRFRAAMPYTLLGRFRHVVGEMGGVEEEAQYGEDVELTVVLPGKAWPSLLSQLDSFGPELLVEAEEGVVYRPAR